MAIQYRYVPVLVPSLIQNIQILIWHICWWLGKTLLDLLSCLSYSGLYGVIRKSYAPHWWQQSRHQSTTKDTKLQRKTSHYVSEMPIRFKLITQHSKRILIHGWRISIQIPNPPSVEPQLMALQQNCVSSYLVEFAFTVDLALHTWRAWIRPVQYFSVCSHCSLSTTLWPSSALYVSDAGLVHRPNTWHFYSQLALPALVYILISPTKPFLIALSYPGSTSR